MKIMNNIEIIDLALHIKGNLILSDFHVGFEESLNKQGILLPRFQFKSIIQRLDNIFLKLNKKIDKIIINGDIKHEFGAISEQEWRHTLRLLDYLSKHCNEVILIKGNHDTNLGPIADKRKIKVLEYYLIDNKNLTINKPLKKVSLKRPPIIKNNVLIIHGNKIPDKRLLKNTDTLIIGHEHPAIGLKEDSRIEVFKCFLRGKYKNKTLIVQPSFNLVTEGTDLMKGKLLSPFLKHDLSNFEVFVVADKVYEFGKLKNLR